MRLQGTMEIKDNVLYIGGVSTLDLVKKYQTPLYVFDEGHQTHYGLAYSLYLLRRPNFYWICLYGSVCRNRAPAGYPELLYGQRRRKD